MNSGLPKNMSLVAKMRAIAEMARFKPNKKCVDIGAMKPESATTSVPLVAFSLGFGCVCRSYDQLRSVTLQNGNYLFAWNQGHHPDGALIIFQWQQLEWDEISCMTIFGGIQTVRQKVQLPAWRFAKAGSDTNCQVGFVQLISEDCDKGNVIIPTVFHLPDEDRRRTQYFPGAMEIV